MTQKTTRPTMKKRLFSLLMLAVLLLAMAGCKKDAPEPETDPTTESTTTQPPTEPTEETFEDDGLPHDKLFITPERQLYEDGGLQLIIPKLNLDRKVYNGTTTAVLAKGVGLYDYAQLPGRGNRNVSIAGHRNNRVNGRVTDDAPFYYVDTIGPGDFMYLRDEENIYRYVHETTYVVEDTDWGPIYSQGYSCLTITSCEPIGVNTHRIIVVGRLDEIFELDPAFIYASNRDELPEDPAEDAADKAAQGADAAA